MYKLSKKGFDKDNIVSYGNMFLIGNGHLGYRGTLEEFSKDEMVGLNVLGFYDKYQNKWRESLNIPNPFFAVLYNDNKSFSILNNKENEHIISLDIKHAIFKRTTKFEELEIKSERFISQSEDNLICFKYQIKCKKDIDLKMDMGCDLNIYEINGPHFPLKEINESNNLITFKGKTNERKYIYETNQYIFPSNVKINHFNNGIYNLNIKGQKGKTYTFYCFSSIDEYKIQKHKKYNIKDYKELLNKHKEIFDKKWNNSDVEIIGNKKAQFAIRYSIYHLLILGNKKYQTSIPARGVSGQTYKGAIFWDTEIFLLPFFTLTDINVAKQLLKYRIKTLKGALRKAKLCGYSGAFYAWESQEKGQEGCSKYNVSDPITNKPVRTYFGEKQIHISADIAYGLINYTNISGDESLLLEGGLEMMVEICNFYISYATFENGKYHLNDVIGPDEYHERVDDNAFTNYMVYHVIQMCVLYMNKYHKYEELVGKFIYFANNLHLPKVNENNLIEQFKDYFKKEDVYVDEVRKRIRHPQEYWGTKNGVAYNTRVIKQKLFIVDYAHTPDGLENVLKLCKSLVLDKKIICLFGCGGNRETQKREKMGEISSKYADFTIITTDNPRFEDKLKIAKEIEKGAMHGAYKIILDRVKSIKFADKISNEGDIILIAGKGAENYIDEKGEKKYYSDYDEIEKLRG